MSDLIEAACETDLVGEHVYTILDEAPPWDVKAEYRPERVVVRVEGAQVPMDRSLAALVKKMQSFGGIITLSVEPA